MNEARSGPGLEDKSHLWQYTPPKWWRVSLTALPLAIFAETVALVIAIDPHGRVLSRVWGCVFCLCIPVPLFWLRNGNRHLRNLVAAKTVDSAFLDLIEYFLVGIVASSYLVIAFLIENLYVTLRLTR
jgi:hypothetical protein